ncbi:epidermal growth factor receptor substrate 15-like 1 isoform X2 [Poecilia formosa]|uniref:epidermal growth factor receptor substrate 15-like 1 isoform X2 n=1 Tax=Poecilia formosa TaxID=48698 RepID=UPI0007B9696D|nr:PREDICTED: epidermal growth factor receptor substrate 15-like 1 isoform X2 [Poecilia formosa]
MSKGIEQFSSTLNGTNGGSMTNLADMSESFNDKESGGFSAAGKGRQEDIFKVKSSVFYNQPQDLQSDLFNSEDPFKTDPFKGDPFESDPFGKAPSTSIDPFEGDPFKEADPFKASSEDFFKKTTKMDHFSTTDPLCKSATLPSKQTSHFAGSDPFSTNHQKPRGSDLFSTLDPFGSSTFNSATNSCTGFADFSHMSKARDPFEGRANWLPDYQKVWRMKMRTGQERKKSPFDQRERSR